jgi:hypothetical protein
MEKHYYFDDIDHIMVRILSMHECLNLTQIWYELGELDPPVERMSEEEILGRLEALQRAGSVKCVRKAGEASWWAVKREESGLTPNGSSSAAGDADTRR